MLTLLRKMT